MPRSISLSTRVALNAAETAEVLVYLVTISHEDLETPIRLSTDPTTRLSLEPLRYGTVHQGDEFEFVLVSALLPDDKDGAPSTISLAFSNVDSDMVSLIRSVKTPARVDMTVVLASSPDDIEEQYQNFRVVRSHFDASAITLEISREVITNEPWPAHRMTQARFPGQFR